MKIRRVDFSPDEWLAGTAELSDEDRGTYITICALIYSRGGPIRYEVLKGHSHSHGNKLQASLDRLESGGKIVRNGSEIDQKRCENELEKARKRHEKALENGAKGGRPNRLAKPDGYGYEKTNHQPSTINHQQTQDSGSSLRSEPAAPTNGAAPEDPEKAFWREGAAYLVSAGMTDKKARDMLGKWRREFGKAAVSVALQAAKNEVPSEPIAFIAACLGNSRSARETRARDPTRPESIGGYVPPEF